MRSEERKDGPPPGWAANPLAAKAMIFFSRHRWRYAQRLLGIVLGSDIGAKFGENLRMPHPYGIIIHSGTVFGRNVVVMHQVTIGARDLSNRAPVIGDDVYIGAGAKILGDIRLGHRCMVGANAVVTKDVPDDCTVVGANRILKQKSGADSLLR